MARKIWKATRPVGVENLTNELQRFEDEGGWTVDKIVPDTAQGYIVVAWKADPKAAVDD